MTYKFHWRFWRGLRSVKSDAGFAVEIAGVLRTIYSEPGRSITFPTKPARLRSERFMGKAGWVIGLSAPVGWSNDSARMNETERKLVEERIVAAMEFLKVPYVLV